MANLDFFAAEMDQRALVDFLFSSTDVRVFESYSLPGQEIREFHSTAELASAFEIGIDSYGNGCSILLQLWSPSVIKDLTIERFSLNPDSCNGHTFRFRISGGGLMQLYFGGVKDRVVTRSHFGHFSLAGASKWGKESGVNWGESKTLSNRIQYHVRKRLAVAKVASCPVLPQAYELAVSGSALKRAVQCTDQYELPINRMTKDAP